MSNKIVVNTTINGEPQAFLCEARETALEVIRETLGLTGAKEGCGNGNCGACNIILDGVLVNSCLVLAAELEGRDVLTIEGVADTYEDADLHPIQQQYLEHAALQCGICTPGFIVSTKALLDENPNPSEHDIRLWLAGNLCRCTGYDKIVRAVIDSAEVMSA